MFKISQYYQQKKYTHYIKSAKKIMNTLPENGKEPKENK